MSEPTIVLIPGLGGNTSQHWQSFWRDQIPNAIIAEQEEWDEPELEHWLETLDTTLKNCPQPIVLVAHSLGCALVAHWVKRQDEKTLTKIAAAMLVATADVESKTHTPDEVRSFAPMPLGKMPFPSLVVISEDDPYVDKDRVSIFARHWGSETVSIGKKGHISVDADIGAWSEGQRMLTGLVQRL